MVNLQDTISLFSMDDMILSGPIPLCNTSINHLFYALTYTQVLSSLTQQGRTKLLPKPYEYYQNNEIVNNLKAF